MQGQPLPLPQNSNAWIAAEVEWNVAVAQRKLGRAQSLLCWTIRKVCFLAAEMICGPLFTFNAIDGFITSTRLFTCLLCNP